MSGIDVLMSGLDVWYGCIDVWYRCLVKFFFKFYFSMYVCVVKVDCRDKTRNLVSWHLGYISSKRKTS